MSDASSGRMPCLATAQNDGEVYARLLAAGIPRERATWVPVANTPAPASVEQAHPHVVMHVPAAGEALGPDRGVTVLVDTPGLAEELSRRAVVPVAEVFGPEEPVAPGIAAASVAFARLSGDVLATALEAGRRIEHARHPWLDSEPVDLELPAAFAEAEPWTTRWLKAWPRLAPWRGTRVGLELALGALCGLSVEVSVVERSLEAAPIAAWGAFDRPTGIGLDGGTLLGHELPVTGQIVRVILRASPSVIVALRDRASGPARRLRSVFAEFAPVQVTTRVICLPPGVWAPRWGGRLTQTEAPRPLPSRDYPELSGEQRVAASSP